mgnify:CR=1 FL=1
MMDRPIKIKPLWHIMIFVMLGCGSRTPDVNENMQVSAKWSEIPQKMKDVDACYIAYIDSSGNIAEYSKGVDVGGEPVDQNTLFEGASLSKTFFAYAFWKALNTGDIKPADVHASICGSVSGTIPVSPFKFLSHTVPCSDSCIFPDFKTRNEFAYSENGYLVLQKAFERHMGMDLEQIATNYIFKPSLLKQASFVWQHTNTNFVDGYYQTGKIHRPIYKLTKPASNGSLYISGRDLVTFTKMLINSRELDSMCVPVIPVKGFDHLYWGRGIGIEKNHGREIAWQWGSNWSFNHILLINRSDRSALICLSNSIIGAKRIRETTKWLLGTDFQLFDYINWY